MHGGVKFYRGAAKAARAYVERDRSRADDYYLAEGTGVAERFTATADVVERAWPMTGAPTSIGFPGSRRSTGSGTLRSRLMRKRGESVVPGEASDPVSVRCDRC